MTNPILVTNYLKLKAGRVLAPGIEEWKDSHYVYPNKSVQVQQGPTLTLTLFVSLVAARQ